MQPEDHAARMARFALACVAAAAETKVQIAKEETCINDEKIRQSVRKGFDEES